MLLLLLLTRKLVRVIRASMLRINKETKPATSRNHSNTKGLVADGMRPSFPSMGAWGLRGGEHDEVLVWFQGTMDRVSLHT